jgi:hypothetical protein
MDDAPTSADARARLMRTPWVVSWVGGARRGDLSDGDPDRRCAAWANWAASALAEINNGRRSYPALRLAGEFYDPHGTGGRGHPHLEVPDRVLRREDGEFPVRLAQCGAGLSFPYWRYDEVFAVRRAMFNNPSGPIGEFVEVLDERRGALRDGLSVLGRYAAPNWGQVAGLIIADADGLVDDACDGFGPEDVTSWLPAAGRFGIHVRFDNELRERNGAWASRRVGVWQILGTTPGGDEFGFGVVTPRLTSNSLFSDPMFDPRGESPAACLVRSLVLRRIIERHLGGGRLVTHRIGDPVPEVAATRAGSFGHLRAVPAQPGQKLPEASLGSAVAFLDAHRDPDAGWAALSNWAERGFLLTVTREAFVDAHRRAGRALRRAEEPERGDVDCLLPIAWDNRDGHAQVVRVTWARGRDE